MGFAGELDFLFSLLILGKMTNIYRYGSIPGLFLAKLLRTMACAATDRTCVSMDATGDLVVVEFTGWIGFRFYAAPRQL